jgi:hypothetical protein
MLGKEGKIILFWDLTPLSSKDDNILPECELILNFALSKIVVCAAHASNSFCLPDCQHCSMLGNCSRFAVSANAERKPRYRLCGARKTKNANFFLSFLSS